MMIHSLLRSLRPGNGTLVKIKEFDCKRAIEAKPEHCTSKTEYVYNAWKEVTTFIR
jgi:hypothetical protein